MSAATPGEDSLAKLLVPLRSAPAVAAILCDMDGTLAPIARDPDAATVPRETRSVLGALASTYALVGCITGRRATVARMMLGLDGLTYAGNHGLELLGPGEAEPRLDPALGRRGTAARKFVARLDGRMLEAVGLRLEDKGPIQALHWRGAVDEETATQRAGDIADLAVREGLVPHLGRKVLELRPVDGIDKGTAVRALLAKQPSVRCTLFGGDDATDLDAFRALRALRDEGALDVAICIGVGSGEQPGPLAELSDLVVPGPQGFLGVLRTLAEPLG